MRQRMLHVAGALAVVVAVAVLARPSQPDVPPPFTVEQETPGPDGLPEPDPPPAATPSPEPTRGRAGQPTGTVVALHTLDGRTLEAAGTPATLRYPVVGAAAKLSEDGRWLAVAVPQPHPGAATVIRLHETATLAAQDLGPVAEVAATAFTDWFDFMPDGDGLVWLENHERAGLRARGATFDAGRATRLETVGLPDGLWLYGAAALRDGRLGLVAVEATERSPAGWGLSAPRLLVADLRTGRITADVQLPLAEAMVVPDESGRVELIPGVAWDVVRDRLYVAHADRDEVLVADLARGALLGSLELGHLAQGPALGALGAGGPGDAGLAGRLRQARGLAQPPDTLYAGTWREATLSGDGTVLYVHGSYLGADEPPVEGQPQPPRRRQLPLLGVDIGTQAMFGSEDAPRGRVLAVGPRAGQVFVAQGFLPRGTPPMLRLLDGRTFAERWYTSTGDGPPALARFSADGERLAVALDEREGASERTGVVVHDTTTGEALGRATFPGRALAVDLDAGLVLTRAFE